MEEIKKCPECGCTKISQAQLDINAKLYPMGAVFKLGKGSEVIAEVCTKCGRILSTRVVRPDKFL